MSWSALKFNIQMGVVEELQSVLGGIVLPRCHFKQIEFQIPAVAYVAHGNRLGRPGLVAFIDAVVNREGRIFKEREVRSLIHLVIGNRPGALLHALSPFDAAGVNLTFIQSRPLPNRPWEYGFFIEAVTDWRSPAAEAAWRLVLALSESGRIIGTYPILP